MRFRDTRLDAQHAALSYATFRADWASVTYRACETAREFAIMLRSRGWDGELTPCPSCEYAAPRARRAS
ncbi:hypothetical protein ADJ73_14110 [Arsenicicoccus sp. oral taxon 190]|nr:hypothetical protein ADJ73_14110 [Arsenicicoccus sp. oral taxon 190]